MNVAELVAIPAGMFPDHEILRFEGDGFSYQTVAEQAGGAQSMMALRGIGPGDVVAGIGTNSPLLVAALLGTTAVGAAFCPLNYRARVDELRGMLDVVRPKLLLAETRYLELVRSVATCDTLQMEQSAAAGEFLPVEVDDAAAAVLLFTSGTSADAKAVELPHSSLVELVFSAIDGADGSDKGSVLLAAPLYHVAGLSALLAATFGGRRIVLMRQFEAANWLQLAGSERVTHAFLVPTMLKHVLDHPSFDPAKLASLQVLSYGAAPMPLPLIRRAIERLPASVQLMNAFGQTETASTVLVLGPEDHRLDGSPAENEVKLRRLRSVGRPLPGVEVSIVDEAGTELPAETVGEISIRSDRLTRGYYGDSASPTEDGLLRTRDLGWMDADGYVYLAGRKSDLIIRGGENIAPDEIEAVLELHPGVAEAAVVGLPDEEWGERVAAVVVAASPGLTEEELIAYCRGRLASFKKPDAIFFADSLPRTALGKLLRKDLRARYATPVDVA